MGNEMSQLNRLKDAGPLDGPNTLAAGIPRLQNLSDAITQHGTEMATALAILIFGLLAVRVIDKGLRKGLRRLLPTAKFVTVFCNTVYIVMVAVVITAAAVALGSRPYNIIRVLTIFLLATIGLIIFLKPFIPSMPFKVGNTVKAGDLLGKVEAITFLNTRMRTFDGKTFFVPNRKILNEIVMNYQFNPTRRIKIDVGIRYDQDLLKAKRVMEAVMTSDPRVKTKPGPMVYVLNLGSNSVDLGGRCWVDNNEYWVAKCDLLEKTKLRFDYEGIKFAFPQLDIHIDGGKSPASASGCLHAGGQTRMNEPVIAEEENI
ncbi:MAG: mechanosensitive ion channel family protein [Pseudomonadota bacterium]